MSEYREFTGKSVEEALRHAREEFGVGLDELDFEILTAGSRGVLGMGAEPARIVAAPRAALGGAAPKREAAAATPLPAPVDRGPRRDDRPPRRDDRPGRSDDRPARTDDRGPRRDDRPGRSDDRPAPARPDAARADLPRTDAPRRDDAPRTEAAPRADAPRRDDRPERVRDRGPRRDDRPARSDDGGPRRDDRPPRRSDDRPGASAVSSSEADEVQTARSLVREREELQAAEASPAALDAGKRLLEQLMQHMGFSVAVNIETGETNRLNVIGADDDEHEALGALIGRKGERLSALQHIVNLMLSREMGEWTRVLVDVEGYRGRREQQLREIADRAAARVVETGKMLQLEPMPALERRWIHLALRNHPAVGTQSIGEEPNRRVVVVPKAVV
jgi:spoIIIJ-associated protein